MTSTKPAPALKSYAQKMFHAVQKLLWRPGPRYQTHSFRKLLIYKETLNCLFTGQFKQGLDLQGFPGFYNKLSTKLSTENLENFSALKNQALPAQAGAVFQAASRRETAR